MKDYTSLNKKRNLGVHTDQKKKKTRKKDTKILHVSIMSTNRVIIK